MPRPSHAIRGPTGPGSRPKPGRDGQGGSPPHSRAPLGSPRPVRATTPDLRPTPIADGEAAAMFRACLNLFRLWKVSDAEASTLLDLPPRTFARWKTGVTGRIGRDQKARLSNLIGIHKALRLIFRDAERSYEWPRRPNQAFEGRSA